MARGAIAIAAVLLASGTPVLSATLRYDFRAVAMTGDTAPGTGGAVYQRLEYAGGLDDTGNVAYGAGVSGGATTSANDTLLMRATPSGSTVVAREGDVVPNAGGVMLGDAIVGVQLNNHGTIAFAAEFAGPGVRGPYDSGILVAEAGSLRVAARRGDAVPDRADARLGPLGLMALNDKGTLVLGTLLDYPGAYYDASALYEEVNGAIGKVVVGGDPAPGTGATFDGWSKDASLNNADELLISSGLSDHTSAVFLRDASGMTLVAHSGGAAPGVAGRTLGPVGGVLGEAGEFLLSASLVDPATEVADGAILYRITQGSWDPLLMTGVAAPGYAAATIAAFGTPVSPNAAGDALIEVWVTYDGFPRSQGHAAYLAGADGSLSLVLRDFLTMDLAGETRLLQSFHGLGFNDQGQIAFQGHYTDGSVAIVVGTPTPIAPVPLPTAIGLALAGFAALAVAGRRRAG